MSRTGLQIHIYSYRISQYNACTLLSSNKRLVGIYYKNTIKQYWSYKANTPLSHKNRQLSVSHTVR